MQGPWSTERLSFEPDVLSEAERRLNELHLSGRGIAKIIHHRKGLEAFGDILMHQEQVLPRGEWKCFMASLEDLDELTTKLNEIEKNGGEIIEIMPHRRQNKMEAVIVAFFREIHLSDNV